MIALYWDIGSMIAARHKEEGWGAKVIPRLALDLKNELPEQKGFSERNIGYMVRFAREYGAPPILGHNILLFEKMENVPTRLWYAKQAMMQELLTGKTRLT